MEERKVNVGREEEERQVGARGLWGGGREVGFQPLPGAYKI